MSLLHGTWALAIISTYEPNNIYVSRHGSPLLVSLNDDYIVIASEQSALQDLTNNYNELTENVVYNLDFSAKLNQIPKQITYHEVSDKGTHDHWMLKEISEQNITSKQILGNYGKILDHNSVKLGGLDQYRSVYTSFWIFVL